MAEYIHSILDMAQLEDKFHGWTISAVSEGGNIPHFHFHTKVNKRDNSFADGGCIMFEKAAYFRHGKYKGHLGGGIHKELREFLSGLTEYKDSRWEFLIRIWNSSGKGKHLDPALEIPDYSNISYADYKKATTAVRKVPTFSETIYDCPLLKRQINMRYCCDVNFYVDKGANDTVLEKADFEAIDRDAAVDICNKCGKNMNRLLITYMGKNGMSYTDGKVYTAKLLSEKKYGKNHLAVCDDDKNWFCTSYEYIHENFQIIERRSGLGHNCYVVSRAVVTEHPNLPLYDGDVDTLGGIHEQDKFYFSQSIQDLVDIIEDGHWTDEFPSILSVLGQKDPNTCMQMCKYVLEKKLGDDFTQYSAVNEIQNLISFKDEDVAYDWDDDEMWAYSEKCINENAKIKRIMDGDF